MDTFANNPGTTTGLTYGYYGGIAIVNGLDTAIGAGTIALSASTTNYVERTYDGVVSKNTTAFTASNIPMASVVTSAGAITTITDYRTPASPVVPYPLLAGETGVTNVLYPWFNIKRYGALGDLSHDDSDAFDAMIASWSAAGGGKCVIPAGNYKLTRSHTFLLGNGTTPRGLTLECDRDATVLFPTIDVTNAALLTINTASSTDGTSNTCTINGLRIDGVSAGTGVIGLLLGDSGSTCGGYYLDGVSIKRMWGPNAIGLKVQDCVGVTGYNCDISRNATNVYVRGGVAEPTAPEALSLPTIVKFIACNFREAGDTLRCPYLSSAPSTPYEAGVGVRIVRGYQVTFSLCCIEGNFGPGVLCDPTDIDVVTLLSFDTCWFEGNWRFLTVAAAQPVWSSGTSYAVGDIVVSGGKWYRCIRAHSGHAPYDPLYWTTSQQNGDVVATNIKGGAPNVRLSRSLCKNVMLDSAGMVNGYVDDLTLANRLQISGTAITATATGYNRAYPAWSGATAYTVGSYVISAGAVYRCRLAHTNHVPPNTTYWDLSGWDGDGFVPGMRINTGGFKVGAVAGAGSISTTAGVGTFTASQAGRILIGSAISVGNATYYVEAFDGTTGVTLSGSPTISGPFWLSGNNQYSTVTAVTATDISCAGTVTEAWSSAIAYAVGDVVLSGGVAYLCVLAHTSQVPPNSTYWVANQATRTVTTVLLTIGAGSNGAFGPLWQHNNTPIESIENHSAIFFNGLSTYGGNGTLYMDPITRAILAGTSGQIAFGTAAARFKEMFLSGVLDCGSIKASGNIECDGVFLGPLSGLVAMQPRTGGTGALRGPSSTQVFGWSDTTAVFNVNPAAASYLDGLSNRVLSTRGAAVAAVASANATDLATAITLVNEIKAQLNTFMTRFRVTGGHGSIAD